MFQDISLIKSKELISNIESIYNEITNKILEYNFIYDLELNHKLNQILRFYEIGVGKPISLCDYNISYSDNTFKILIAINYKVTSCYEPYQELDRPIILECIISKNHLRDNIISKLIS